MNDARWLRYWITQHVEVPLVDQKESEELARQAEQAAARDGFSVDDALREEGCDTLRAFIVKILKERTT